MDYIGITNYNRLGEMGISRNAIRSIALSAVSKVPGARVYSPKADKKKKKEKKESPLSELFTLPSGVKVSLSKDGHATIKIEVVVQEGSNASEIAKGIQKEVGDSIMMMCESLAYEVSIRIARIEAI